MEEIMRHQHNSFDELRLFLAINVMLVHCSVLSGADALAWLQHYFDANFAVKGFLPSVAIWLPKVTLLAPMLKYIWLSVYGELPLPILVSFSMG